MARRIFLLAVSLALTSLTFAKQPQWPSATHALTLSPSAAAFTMAADAVVNLAPQAGAVVPSTGNGATQTFSFQYSDANGVADLRMAKALFNTAVSYNQACVLTYDPHAAVAYLQSENGTLGPLAMGSANTLQNSYCSVNLAQSSASAGGDTLMVNWAITFGPGFVGEKNIYGLAQDNSGVNSPWQLLGTWMPAAAVNTPPSVLSVTPNNGSGTTQSFSFQYSDVNGYGYLHMVKASFNTNTSYNQGCVVTYDPHAKVVYLQSEYGTLGPLPIGSNNSLYNPYCNVSLGQSSASGSGNTLTLNLALTFQPGFQGTKTIYGLAQDNGGLNSPWKVLGSWMPAVFVNTAPSVVSVTPQAGSGITQMFSFKYSDANGFGDLGMVKALFNTKVSYTQGCVVTYDPHARVFYLQSESGTVGPMPQGSTSPLQNEYCSVNLAQSYAWGGGSTLTLDLALTFTRALMGDKTIYALAQDKAKVNSPWQVLGSWTVPDIATVISELQAGKNPEGITVNPVTHKAYVVGEVDDPDRQVVMVFDEAALSGTTAPKLIEIPDETEYLTVDPLRNRIYLSTRYGVEEGGDTGGDTGGDAPLPAPVVTPGTLTVIDGNTDTVVASYQFPEGVEPEGVAVDVPNNIVYVGTKAPEPEPENGVCPWGTWFIDEDGDEECWTAGSIVAFNAVDVTKGPIKTIPAGDDPESVVFTNGKVYAANEDDGTITIANAVKPDGSGGELITDTPAYSPALPPYSLGVFYAYGPNSLACPDKRYEADKMAAAWDGLDFSVFITDDKSRVAKIQGADVVGETGIPIDPKLGQCVRTPNSDENGLNTANNVAFLRCPQIAGETSSRSAVYVVSEQNTVAILDPLTLKLKTTITVPNAVHLDAVGVDASTNRVWITDEALMKVFVLKGVCSE